MVLEIKVPSGDSPQALLAIAPILSIYAVSFLHLAIYWNNHHHMVHEARRVNGTMLWYNHLLLFWLSLVPVTTAWMGRSGFASFPTFCYGADLIFSAVAYTMLQNTIIKSLGPDSSLAKAVNVDYKGKMSLIGYLLGMAISLFQPLAGLAMYLAVGISWFLPDRRIEKNHNPS